MDSKKGAMKIRDVLIALGFIILCLLAGAFGSIFTIQNISTWYATLNKPSFSPPNWVFGPVWTTLYILMGISAYLIYSKTRTPNPQTPNPQTPNGLNNNEIRLALGVFGIQLILNALWSFLFFGLQSPVLGLVCIVFLWFAIVATIIEFHKISKPAAYLLIPYLLWVSFASFLNYTIWTLN